MTRADLIAKLEAATSEMREIMRHSLGLTRGTEMYRNYFCADDGHADMPIIEQCIVAGLMRASHKINGGRDTIYVVTESGIAALRATETEDGA